MFIAITWRTKWREWVARTRMRIGQSLTIGRSIFDNWWKKVYVFFCNLWQSAGHSLTICQKDLMKKHTVFVSCQRLTCRLSKICVILVLVLSMYFLSPLQDGNFKLVMSMSLDRTVSCLLHLMVNQPLLHPKGLFTSSKNRIEGENCLWYLWPISQFLYQWRHEPACGIINVTTSYVLPYF